jgi:hypothetical protein
MGASRLDGRLICVQSRAKILRSNTKQIARCTRQAKVDIDSRKTLGNDITMSDEGAQLSNPFSSGGGGHNFENHVQAGFVVLMLSGGIVPCLPPWPIKEIKLQGRYAGHNTDDCIVVAEEKAGGRKARLLAQIKHSLSISESDSTFSEVILAAWSDFQNAQMFDPKIDAIALISGPLSAHDIENARRILEWARTSAHAQEFLDKVNLGKFSSQAKRNKLAAFRTQLKKANKGGDVTDEQLWSFLKSFHILGYDLDIHSGVTLSLLNSHISQFSIDNISGLWATVAKEVEMFNQNAGTITRDTISNETRVAFSERLRFERIPEEFLPQKQQPPPADFGGDEGEAVVYAALLGGWNDKSEGDQEATSELIGEHD